MLASMDEGKHCTDAIESKWYEERSRTPFANLLSAVTSWGSFFKEDVGTSLKSSRTNCTRLCSIHDHSSEKGSLFHAAFHHWQRPCWAHRAPRSVAFGWKRNEVRLTKQSGNTALTKKERTKNTERRYMLWYVQGGAKKSINYNLIWVLSKPDLKHLGNAPSLTLNKTWNRIRTNGLLTVY